MWRLVHVMALIALPFAAGLRRASHRKGLATQAAGGDQKMVAFIENWLECPTLEQIQGYTHVVVSFAVSYTYNAAKNECDPQCKIVCPCGHLRQLAS